MARLAASLLALVACDAFELHLHGPAFRHHGAQRTASEAFRRLHTLPIHTLDVHMARLFEDDHRVRVHVRCHSGMRTQVVARGVDADDALTAACDGVARRVRPNGREWRRGARAF